MVLKAWVLSLLVCAASDPSLAMADDPAVDAVVDAASEAVTEAAQQAVEEGVEQYNRQQQERLKRVQKAAMVTAAAGAVKRAKMAKLRRGLNAHSTVVAGQERHYAVYVPKSYEQVAVHPVVFVLHGGGWSTIKEPELYMVKLTKARFHELADRDGGLIVYPRGIHANWNDGRPSTYRETGNADDLAFFRQMIGELAVRYAVDPRRVFSTGISNGGQMSYRLACEMTDALAGIAAVAANLSVEIGNSCKPTRPLPVLIINGVEDPLTPWGGGASKFGRGTVLSTHATRDFWRQLDGCGAPTRTFEKDDLPRDRTSIKAEIYDTCASGAAVALYGVQGGGHTWPSGNDRLPDLVVGRASREIDAADVIWDFFMARPGRQAPAARGSSAP